MVYNRRSTNRAVRDARSGYALPVFRAQQWLIQMFDVDL